MINTKESHNTTQKILNIFSVLGNALSGICDTKGTP